MSKTNNQTKKDFLLSFFNKDQYQEKSVNGFWLIKSINGETGKWRVAIFTEESFKNYKNRGNQNKLI